MSQKYSQITQVSITYGFWLIFGSDGAVRLSRGEPSVSRGERGMSCTAALPRSLFRTPTLVATIGVDDMTASEFKIDITAASEAPKGAIGCDVDLRVNVLDGGEAVHSPNSKPGEV